MEGKLISAVQDVITRRLTITVNEAKTFQKSPHN